MSGDKTTISRRELLGAATVAGAGLAAGILPVHAAPVARSRRVGANDRVQIALIGCGGQGPADMEQLMGKPEVEVVALCDVDKNQLPKHINEVTKKYGRVPDVYYDYRKLLERKDINAVIIGTPDHWHALNLIHAVEAGKDAYSEKPVSHDITEAKTMAAAAAQHKAVVQIGTWQRSTGEFNSAVNYIRSGKLGKVVSCHAWITDERGAGRAEQTAPPPGFDFDMWTGPAAAFPYAKNRIHNSWRWFFNTGTGKTGDWGVHMMDIAFLAMSQDTDLVMPTEVSAVGGKWRFVNDDREAPDTVQAIMRFRDPDFILRWETDGRKDQPDRPYDCTEFVSAEGNTLRVWRGGWAVFDPTGEQVPAEKSPAITDHFQNWLDCIKSREQPRSNIASMVQSTINCHLVNIALLTGEQVRWSKEKMDIVGKTGRGSIYYSREYRKPWKLPVYKLA